MDKVIINKAENNELEVGKKIEMEHRPTYNKIKKDIKQDNKLDMSMGDMAESIARDHTEGENMPDYYDDKKGLPEMERRLKHKGESKSMDKVIINNQEFDAQPEVVKEANPIWLKGARYSYKDKNNNLTYAFFGGHNVYAMDENGEEVDCDVIGSEERPEATLEEVEAHICDKLKLKKKADYPLEEDNIIIEDYEEEDYEGYEEWSLRELLEMPTISQGQTDNLKYEDEDTRVWLSRMTVEDGMPYNNQVTVEKYIDNNWVTVDEYEAV